MAKRAKLIIFVLALCIGATVWRLVETANVVTAAEPSQLIAPGTTAKTAHAECTLYADDPKHLWNQLHHALFVRISSDGKLWGMDRVDPLLWPESTHLLEGESHRRALAALDRFLEDKHHQTIDDPLKRTMLHAGLWAVFDWSSANRLESRHLAERRALQTRLAHAMQRLALSAAEIQQLPDNYAAAVESGKFARAFDPQHPERPFLPPDLFQKDGPWVLIAANELAAPAHTQFASGRSVFTVYLHLPGGRQATLDYLQHLRGFSKPWLINERYGVGPNTERNPTKLNPDLPQFPAGTQAALVRQMMTIDTSGQLRPTRLTQMVQLRVYRSIGQRDQSSNEHENSQAFFEFSLSPQKLFAGTTGGLRPVERDHRDFVQFQSHTYDQLSHPQTVVMKHCSACHNAPGIFSLHSYTHAFGPQSNRPVLLEASHIDDQIQLTQHFKHQQYNWGLLEGLLAREE